jgi:EpsI family protein
MTALARHSSTALALIAAAGILVGLLAPRPTSAPEPNLGRLSPVIAGWLGRDGSPAGPLAPDRQAVRHLVRTYERDGRATWLAVDYYADQVEGQRAVARHLVFPSHGVNEVTERTIPLPGPRGGTANLATMRRGAERFATLYWYQLPGHAVADDHWYRALLLWRRLVHRRADGALVRIAFPAPDGTTIDAALDARVDLLRHLSAEIEDRLPP